MRDYLSIAKSRIVNEMVRMGHMAEAVVLERGLVLDDSEPMSRWPLPNVWLGVSVEDQARADERIPLLLQTPAAVRFLSCEPLLGPVDLKRVWVLAFADAAGEPMRLSESLHWCIAGGESGPGARPMHPDWVRSLRDQCQAAGVAFFFKQEGAWTARRPETYCRMSRCKWSHESVALFEDGTHYKANEPDTYGTRGMVTLFRHGGHNSDPAEWPEDLRVRQFPEV
jgi:protein gp37